MAEQKVATNSYRDKAAKSILDSFDIIETPTEWGGKYNACGKCGAHLYAGDITQKARDKMAKALEESVFTPLGLLAGLLANVSEDDGSEVDINIAGHLLGLTVHGARKTLEIQQMGGTAAHWLQQILEAGDGQPGKIGNAPDV